MDPLARTRAVLSHLHAQAPSQVESGKRQVQLLSDGLQRPNVPFTVSSFAVNAELAAISATPEHMHAVSDLPVLDAGHSASTSHTRINVPMPFMQPMVAEKPSTWRVEAYKRSMLGESMALEAHIALPNAARVGGPRLGSARFPAVREDSMSLADATAAGSAPSSSPLAAASSEVEGPSRFTELDVLGFRAHYDAAGRVAAVHGSEPDLALVRGDGDGDTGDDEAVTAGRATGSGQLLRTRRALDHVRSCAAGAPLGSAKSIDPLLAVAAGQRDTTRGSSRSSSSYGSASGAAVDPAVQAAQYSRERARAHFTPATRELLGSIAAFRAGLAHLEQTRRRRNGTLNRDPADDSHLWWHRSLPGGFDSPFPL